MSTPKTNTKAIERYIQAVSLYQQEGLFNPWAEVSPDEADPQHGAARRIERLRAHLQNPDVRVVLIGEAPGYQGARYSGIAFTSERLLLEGAIPRIPDLMGQRISTRPRPWSEPSASIVWKALYEVGLAEQTILWNSVPWHPHKPGNPHSNRTPTEEERAVGLEYLELFVQLYPGAVIAAVGATSKKSLDELGIEATLLRHPANGGATKFRQGLIELKESLDG